VSSLVDRMRYIFISVSICKKTVLSEVLVAIEEDIIEFLCQLCVEYTVVDKMYVVISVMSSDTCFPHK
jgi:hypothetical protein